MSAQQLAKLNGEGLFDQKTATKSDFRQEMQMQMPTLEKAPALTPVAESEVVVLD